jgi:hypothetical protein
MFRHVIQTFPVSAATGKHLFTISKRLLWESKTTKWMLPTCLFNNVSTTQWSRIWGFWGFHFLGNNGSIWNNYPFSPTEKNLPEPTERWCTYSWGRHYFTQKKKQFRLFLMYTSGRFVVLCRRESPNITTAEVWGDTIGGNICSLSYSQQPLMWILVPPNGWLPTNISIERLLGFVAVSIPTVRLYFVGQICQFSHQ